MGNKILIVVLGLILPLLAGVALSGSIPASLSLQDIEAWSPLKAPGPSANLLAAGVTRMAGVKAETPEWLQPEDKALLDEAVTALRGNQMKIGLGKLLTLSGSLEEKGHTIQDITPLVAPELVGYVVATYFAPVLLGCLSLTLVLVFFMPWLIRRLYDLVRVLATLMLFVVIVGGLSYLTWHLAAYRAILYALIEYMTAAAGFITVGNLLLLWQSHREDTPIRPKGADFTQFKRRS